MKASKPSAPKEEALSLLKKLKIEEVNQLKLEKIAKYLGIKIHPKRLDGCAALIIGIGDRAIINVDHSTSIGRQRFSIAHEFAHWIYDRHKGVYLCSNHDINAFSDGKVKTNIEKRANVFAAELLMPTPWFREVAKKYPLSFESIHKIRQLFNTGFTSTAIKTIECGDHIATLAMYNGEGKRTWYCAAKDFPEHMYPVRTIPTGSNIFRDITHSDKLISNIEESDGDEWMDHPESDELTVFNQGMRVGKGILVLYWIADSIN